MAQCKYVFRNNQQCPNEDAGNGLCFWHDPSIEKDGKDVAAELEVLAKSGQLLEGFSLTRANLSGVNLVNRGSKQGYDICDTDMYRANLHCAHLFMADLEGASLMKADLTDANLHYANLKNANLLGTKFKGAKIENVTWGEKLLQEQKGDQALKEKNFELAHDYYEQAEEVCRNIRNVAHHQGLLDMAGRFFHKEMVMKRKQLPKICLGRFISKLVDVTCGYGEKPSNVFVFSIFTVFINACLYFLFGIQSAEGMVMLGQGNNLMAFGNCLYYSTVTFTTLGYGDLVPVGISRLFAALEAFTGSFTMALFVVVFVKKMTR